MAGIVAKTESVSCTGRDSQRFAVTRPPPVIAAGTLRPRGEDAPAYNGAMRFFLMLALAALLAACSPEQNWRQVTFEATSLKVQLPCKPDRTTREVPLGGMPVQLSVAGCESGQAMLAVMTAVLAPGADAQAVLTGWQQATLAHLQAPAPTQAEPWQRPGMLPLGAAQRLQAVGQRSDGQRVAAQAVWGAFAEGDHIRVVHAVVYAPKVDPELAQGLFDGVRP